VVNLAGRFKEIWCVDFEYIAGSGERPVPVCCVAQELRSGLIVRQWSTEFGTVPPYAIGPESLFVSFAATAEFSCSLVLNWPRPAFILDLYVEYKNLTNGKGNPGPSLLQVLSAYGLSHISSEEKTAMRDLILRGGPWSWEERNAILDYCYEDVRALKELFPKMIIMIDLPRAVQRGRYMHAVACMEHVGVPFDMEKWTALQERWSDIQSALIIDIDSAYHVYENGHWRDHLFEEYLIRNGIPWPRLKSDKLELTDDVFEEMAKSYPQLLDLRYLRAILGKMRLFKFPVGHDGRNRAWLTPFWTKTGRNQPSSKMFIFAASSWMRGLVAPPPGYGLANIDWSNQEFAIAAYMSSDSAMIAAYESGDPYIWFAKKAGAIPQDATKESFEKWDEVRGMYKVCVLGIQYFVGPETLASQINQSTYTARKILRLHHELFRRYWEWLDEAMNYTFIHASQATVYGWTEKITDNNCNPRAVGNFFSQANGAEMLRLACIFGTEAGIEICAPIHDAILIMAPLDRLESDVAAMQNFMADASAYVLDGPRIRSEAMLIRYPDRYMKKKGQPMWDRIMKFL
jgi:DNA polymerase I